MNIKFIISLISSLILCFLLSSCSNDNTTTTYIPQTKDAQIYSFAISGEHNKTGDSISILIDKARFEVVNKTKFAIDQISGTIYNPDSMPHGTVLRNVLVTATYNSSYGVSKVTVTTPDSLQGYTWNNSDSIFFGKMPVSMMVSALSGNTKSYKIDIRIHKVDPDTLVWRQMSSQPTPAGKSKTLLINDEKFYTYSLYNGKYTLYTSGISNIDWQQQEVTGLASDVNPENIYEMNSVLFATDAKGSAYKSSDGKTWAKITTNRLPIAILGILPAENRTDDQLLVSIKEGEKYYFGKTKDMASIDLVENISSSPSNNEIPSGFPLQRNASYTNFSTDKNTRMLVVTGGIESNGNETAYSWLIKDISGGLEITPFATNAPFKGAGLSIFGYDKKLYALYNNQFYISNNWGNPWNKAPNKQMLDPKILKRSGQSVITDKENYIWIFGGISENGTLLNDVWKGQINRLNP